MEDLSLMTSICCALLLSLPVLLATPSSEEQPRHSFFVSLSIAVTAVLLYQVAGMRAGVVSVVCSLELSAHMLARTVRKYSSTRDLFLCKSVWNDVTDFSKLMMVVLYLLLSSLSLALDGMESSPLVLLPLSLALYALSYYKAYTGRTLLLKASDEQIVRDMIASNAHPSPEMDNESEIMRMNALYSKVLTAMDEKMVFLDPDLSIREMAANTFSNRTYLSKTINTMSGKSFPQFVNSYRVSHALKLIEKDPHLKVHELASMSGFNSNVTFTMAFKLFVGMTPSEYIEKAVAERLSSRPSRKKERER